MLDAKRTGALEEPIHGGTIKVAGAAKAIRARDAGEEFEVDLLRQAAKRTVADVLRLAEHPRFQVVRSEADDLRADVEAIDCVDVQAIEQAGRRRYTGFLVIQ